MTINASQFNDIHDAHLEYEQNEEGYHIMYNGVSLYLSSNINKTQCMWITGSCIYTIDGQVTISEILEIVNQIIGDEINE